MTSYQAFLFDMDGTIVDTLKDICASVNFSLKKHGLKEITLEQCQSYIGDGSVKLIQRALTPEHMDIFDSVFKVYYDDYNENFCVTTKPYPHLLDSLAYAKKKGILLFIYTNKPEKIALEVMQRCFPKDTFAEMVGIPLGGKVKPDPEAFFTVGKRYGLDYSRCAYFGDSITDIKTAHNLGISNMYSVLWGYQSKEKLLTAPYKPKDFLTDPSEIALVADGKR